MRKKGKLKSLQRQTWLENLQQMRSHVYELKWFEDRLIYGLCVPTNFSRMKIILTCTYKENKTNWRMVDLMFIPDLAGIVYIVKIRLTQNQVLNKTEFNYYYDKLNWLWSDRDARKN